jgi:polysaccharide export outer membrane protein
VTVAVTAINSYRFVVSGNVEKPGAFTSNHYVTVGEAMALAGGPNRFADPGGTVIIRVNADGATHRIPIDYNGVLAGTRPTENLPLLAGDTIYVP